MAIANTTIQLKKSSVAGNVPVSLSSGELALNFYDGKLYYKNAQNTINYFAAGIDKSFATVNSNSSLILASSNNDILSFAAGNNISISTDTVGKTITIGTDAKMLYTAANTAPITPRLGDKWYYIARDLLYEWSTDGTSFFWLDNLSPTTTSNPGGSTGGTTDLTPVFIKANAAFNKANSANILAQAAFTKANSANILAQAAFTKANTASDSIIIIQGVDDTQNNSISIIQGVDVTQNTNITAINNLATSSFDKANSANILAQAAFTAANAAGSSAFTQAAFNSANTKLSLSGGIIAGNVTANSVIANSSIYAPTFYSTGATSRLDLTDIGLVVVSVASQEFKFGASGIESSPGLYGGSYGGNRLSLNNETNLISNRYDTVKIQTGTTGTVANEWSFSNNRLIFPDNTYQNTAFTDAQVTNITAADTKAQAAFDTANTANITGSGAFSQSAFNKANSANVLAQAAFNQANTAYNLANTSPIIGLNSTSITSNVVIGTNYNGFSVGPLIINNGASVTITSGQRWVII